LREAIETSDNNAQVPGAIAGECAAGEAGPGVRDTIVFSLGAGVQTIAPATPLPLITDRLEIDGRNGTVAGIRVELDGNSVPATGSLERGLAFTGESAGSSVHHIAVFGFPDDGIQLSTDEGEIARVISGMDQAGESADANGGNGLAIGGAATTVEASVFSGNGVNGIAIDPSTAGKGAGIEIRTSAIGTSKSGAVPVPNAFDGISAALTNDEGEGLTIGGPTDPTPNGECDGDCNLISGNEQSGIDIAVTGAGPETLDGLAIEGNFVGTDGAGASAVPNSAGASQEAVKLRGAIAGAELRGNLISGNDDDGVGLLAGSTSDAGPTATAVEANTIGMSTGGVTPLANVGSGIRLDRSLIGAPSLTGTTIGGPSDPTPGGDCDGDCNLISGNEQSGIVVFDAGYEGGVLSQTSIAGNYLGVDRGGTLDRGNGGWGVQLSQSSGTTIGDPGSPNVISGNGASGVLLIEAAGNVVRANLIGLGADGITALGNEEHGIATQNAAGPDTIGGPAAADANAIAHNGDAGVMLGGGVLPTAEVAVLGNSIFSNGGLGIDLRPDLLSAGVTENGACNQVEGANDCQEFPVLTAAAGPTAAAAGTLSADPGKDYRIEVFANSAPDPSGNGEGERFLGAVETATDGSGDAAWLLGAPGVPLSDGEGVAATATELAPGGAPLSTSELSDVLVAPVCDLTGDGLENTLVGGPGDEVICGFGGADSLTGGGGRDALLGGEGDDTIFADDGQGDALVDCGPGVDVVHADEEAVDPGAILVGCETVLRPAVPVPTAIAAAPVTKCRGKRATIVGSGKTETIRGTGKADVIVGLGGNDKIKGKGGNDTICGGNGKDTVEGGDGKDVAEGGYGADTLRGGKGEDTLFGDKGKDLIKGGDGADRLSGGKSGGDVCDGGGGRDRPQSSKSGCEKRRSL